MPTKRLYRLQLRLKSLPVSAVLVSHLTNIRYLTGVHASSALLLVTRSSAVLFVDSRYTEEAGKKRTRGVIVASPDDLPRYLHRFRNIGFESDWVTVSRLARWKAQLKNKKFVQLKGFVEGLRKVKDPHEIALMSEACAITKKALARVSSFLTYGMTERELALRLYVYCMEHGADGMAFETIVGFGESTSKPHHRPSGRKLRRGDIIQVDMGATYEGYASDYSRVYFTSDPTPKQRKALRALTEAKKAVERLLKPGVLNTALDAEARRVLAEHGFTKEFSHSLGHGVGLDIHEGTTLSSKAKETKLLKNEVVTVEPGLYFPGKFGMRLEDTRVVGDPDF